MEAVKGSNNMINMSPKIPFAQLSIVTAYYLIMLYKDVSTCHDYFL